MNLIIKNWEEERMEESQASNDMGAEVREIMGISVVMKCSNFIYTALAIKKLPKLQ